MPRTICKLEPETKKWNKEDLLTMRGKEANKSQTSV